MQIMQKYIKDTSGFKLIFEFKLLFLTNKFLPVSIYTWNNFTENF